MIRKNFYIIILSAFLIMFGCNQERKPGTAHERQDQEGPTVVDLQSEEAQEDPLHDRGDRSVVEVAQNEEDLSVFSNALRATGLDQLLLDEADQYTVFAPNNAAWNELGQERIEELFSPENREELTEIIRNHIVNYYVDGPHLTNQKVLNNLDGGNLVIEARRGEPLRVNDATVLETDIPAQNGVVHVIDEVLTNGSRP
jgi:uncharacterized surface protein with fasciclin (FAS1) repeats